MTDLATPEFQTRSFCAQYSREAGEELAGTVKPVDLWLLIECRSRWERDAASSLPESVTRQVEALRLRFPKIRLALIRQPNRSSGPLRLYWAFSKETKAELHEGEFDNYEDISLSPEALPGASNKKIFAVCTHGTHDLCCAQFGNKIYSKLQTLTTDVWQISHIGGCRFAPNIVCLPHGIVYGRVDTEDCSGIVSSYQKGELVTERLRGRSSYPKHVQAAEQFLRNTRRVTALDAFSLQSAEQTGSCSWLVTFRASDMSFLRTVVEIEPASVMTYKSCSVTELLPRDQFLVSESSSER